MDLLITSHALRPASRRAGRIAAELGRVLELLEGAEDDATIDALTDRKRELEKQLEDLGCTHPRNGVDMEGTMRGKPKC